MRNYLWLLVVSTVLLGLGCNRGYISAEAMESGEIGPRNCEQTCSELGLQMGAFVMVQHSYAGCVCQPVRSAGGTTPELAGAGVQAGAVLAVGEARRRQQQQARRQQQN